MNKNLNEVDRTKVHSFTVSKMRPAGTENPGHHNYPARPAGTPFAAAAPPRTPFMSSGPVVGSDASSFRPAHLPGTNEANIPTVPSSSSPPSVGNYPRFMTPQFPSTAPSSNVRAPAGPSVFTPTMQPSANQIMPPPVSFGPQPQKSSVPMGSPLQNMNPAPSGLIPQPPLDSFSAPRPNLQPPTSIAQPFPGYAHRQLNAGPQGPPVQSTFLGHQGGYASAPQVPPPFLGQQVASVQPPPLAGSAVQHPGSGPPLGPMQGLAEDFSSLSLGSVPGSMDPGLDVKALPRPLDGDVESNSFYELYPMNCDSRYFRLTTTAIPNSQSLISRWHLPLGAVVCPLAPPPVGEEVPVINFASTGIIRCRRCRTYINPYVTFTDSGRKWRCNICSLLNDVTGDYFAHLDATGRRTDLDQRPELSKGSVEFVAPTEYMVRPPMPPSYFFLIDVSYSSVRSGMLESSLNQPQMMVVSDLEDIFVPLPDDLLVNLSESRNVVDAFLDSLPSIFQNTANVESCFGPALKAAFMVMSQLGGKLLIFQSTLPSLGIGRLRLRGDDLRVYGTDKEYSLRIAEDSFYKQMAADLSKYQIGVNVYAFSDKYTDIASLGTLAKYTGGQVYYYPNFQSAIHGEKLRHELSRDLTRETAWEAVMRVRCGKGVRFTTYHGNFMLRSTDLLALPAVDCDKAYAMQLSLEETLLTTSTVYFQVALLYTSSSGERRIRVHTAAAPVVTDLGEMYRQADTRAIISVLARLAIEKSLSHKLEDARQSIQQRIVKAFREYRNLYAVQHRLSGRMIYPESLKFLPLYGLALCKSMALRGGHADALLDDRCAAGYTMMALPVKRLLKLLYPDLIRIDEYLLKASGQTDDSQSFMKRLPLAAESLDYRGLYIYDDGFRFLVWFGRMLAAEIITSLLGIDLPMELSKVSLFEHDNEISRKLLKILNRLRENDPSYYQLCHLVRQGEQPREGLLFLTNLIEDQIGGTNGYADWMLQLHRQLESYWRQDLASIRLEQLGAFVPQCSVTRVLPKGFSGTFDMMHEMLQN
ncbi:Sec23/Sec24, helical domain [Dillenia turbinata]|uniref:Sec23/Sec24, helical domain n=1 Tax=Dillenia turbinata TaxID=194707 RepID=A0AAN8YZK3_9MAGN